VKLPAGHDAAGYRDFHVAEALCHHSQPEPQAATRCRETGYLATTGFVHQFTCNVIRHDTIHSPQIITFSFTASKFSLNPKSLARCNY